VVPYLPPPQDRSSSDHSGYGVCYRLHNDLLHRSYSNSSGELVEALGRPFCLRTGITRLTSAFRAFRTQRFVAPIEHRRIESCRKMIPRKGRCTQEGSTFLTLLVVKSTFPIRPTTSAATSALSSNIKGLQAPPPRVSNVNPFIFVLFYTSFAGPDLFSLYHASVRTYFPLSPTILSCPTTTKPLPPTPTLRHPARNFAAHNAPPHFGPPTPLQHHHDRRARHPCENQAPLQHEREERYLPSPFPPLPFVPPPSSPPLLPSNPTKVPQSTPQTSPTPTKRPLPTFKKRSNAPRRKATIKAAREDCSTDSSRTGTTRRRSRSGRMLRGGRGRSREVDGDVYERMNEGMILHVGLLLIGDD
jgi:hypothetical protein